MAPHGSVIVRAGLPGKDMDLSTWNSIGDESNIEPRSLPLTMGWHQPGAVSRRHAFRHDR
jgi:hypothetical protein